MFALGLYLGTQSHENMRQHGRGVLQVLQSQHARLFSLLGKTSAKSADKVTALEAEGITLVERFGHKTIADAASVMELEVVSDFMPCGDHEVVLCRVARWENLTPEPRVLYTGELRAAGYM